MSAIRELTVYAALRTLANKLPDDQISSILESVSHTVNGIKTTRIYKETLQRIRDNEFLMPEHLATMLTELEQDHPHLDSTAILWLIGLRCAATIDKNEHDPEHAIQVQLALFLASQSDNFYRIEDDRMRLLVTYTYLQTANRILFENDNDN